ncbi:MAG: hypothetical protein ABI644_04015 [Arenimonas sp.]
MSGEETKKHWVAHTPSILTGLAALTAALTTVYVNVRNDKSAAAIVSHAAPAAGAEPQAGSVVELPSVNSLPAKQLNRSLDLQLDRVRVDNDGTMGTTNWTFDIKGDERSLFSVPFKSLTDKAGANIVAPEPAAVTHARLTVGAGNMPVISVRGWKQAWSGKAQMPDVTGQVKLNPDDDGFVIEAKSEKAGGPSFVLYFNIRNIKKT